MTLPHLPLHLPVSYGHSLFSGLATGSTLTLQALGHARFCAKALQLTTTCHRLSPAGFGWSGRGSSALSSEITKTLWPPGALARWSRATHVETTWLWISTTPSTSFIFNLARTSAGTAGCRWRYVDPAKPQSFAAMNFIRKWHFVELRLQLWQSPNLPQRMGTMLHWPCENRLERPRL